MTRRQKLIDLVRRGSRAAFPTDVANSSWSRLFVAQGQAAAMQVRAVELVDTLADVELGIFSQWGEDGIIEWLVHHMGPMPESFIEFGVEDYRESNTRFLLCNRNWRGLVIDGDAANIEVIQRDAIYWRHNLSAVRAFITRENVNALFAAAGFTGELGILSVDIDGNDYWVWQAIDCVKPQIVIVEYNAVLGDVLPLVIPYDPSFVRTKAHHSNLYYGTSITAADGLATERGYTRLGTNRAGSNAFYVRNDRLDRFAKRITSTAARPSQFREARAADGRLTFTTGRERSTVIGRCVVTNVESGQTGPLESFGQLYSPDWIAAMEGVTTGS